MKIYVKLAFEKCGASSSLTQRLEQQGPMMVEQYIELVLVLVQRIVGLEQIRHIVELLLGRHNEPLEGKRIAPDLEVNELPSSVNSNTMERRERHLLRPMPSKQREQHTVNQNKMSKLEKKSEFRNVYGISSSILLKTKISAKCTFILDSSCFS